MHKAELAERHSVAHVAARLAVPWLGWLALALLALWDLDGWPAWWDEGWTLSVARMWVERGFYGRLLDGQLIAPNLQALFPVTGPVALCMRIFGVGIWQGRLFGVSSALAALALLHALTASIFNRRVATGTVGVLLLTTMHPQLHPLLMGRQAMAEMPMLAYLLVGYVCLQRALDRSPWWIVPAALGWGVGIASKGQPLPFWALSLLAPLGLYAWRREWRSAGLLGLGIVGALVTIPAVTLVQTAILSGRTATPPDLDGLNRIAGLAPGVLPRLRAAQVVLLLGLPAIFGLLHALRGWRVRSGWRLPRTTNEMMGLALLVLSGSWLAWFVACSSGIERYIFPATFFAAPFIAALLRDLTFDFDALSTLRAASQGLRHMGRDRRRLGALAALLLLAATVPLTLLTVFDDYVTHANHSTQATAEYLNTHAPQHARIETYESELHFLLQRPYHYPPDQIHIELNRRLLLGEDVPINYDPLAANPDYLVVGRFGKLWGLYNVALESGAFRRIQTFGDYDIYERVRGQVQH